MRIGDAHTDKNIEGFLQDPFARLDGKRVGLFRADSGFNAKSTFDFLEVNKVNYVVAVRHNAAIQRTIAGLQNWWSVDAGIEITECSLQGVDWPAARRLVVVRQALKERP